MKRLSVLLMSSILMLSLSACTGPSSEGESSQPSANSSSSSSSSSSADSSEADVVSGTASSEDSAQSGKTLVVYFSASGNTKAVSEVIAENLGAELYEIVPETPYTDADLNWTDSGSRVNAEHNDPSFRTAIAGDAKNLDEYDTIFIGYPIWWGEAPSIVWNFVETSSLTGKTVIPFCTSTSSGFGSSGDTLEEMAPDANWLEGRRFGERPDSSTVIQWVESLDIA